MHGIAPLDDAVIAQRIAVYKTCNYNQAATARQLNISRSTFQNTLDQALKRGLLTERGVYIPKPLGIQHPGRLDLDISDGTVLVGSDAHIWPGPPTPAMRGFLWACAYFGSDLRAVVLNGDVLDGATISRHARIGWTHRPTLLEELKAVHKQLTEISSLVQPKVKKIWSLGNHDQRYENAIANGLPEFQEVEGTRLKDHFPDWEPCWSVWVNDTVVIKHRYRGGIHATYNNTIHSGKTIVTGHLHSLKVTPFSDYNGTRWGVDTGMLATPYTEPFVHYTEASSVSWRPGFAVLSFVNGELMWPELVAVRSEDTAMFRGRLISF